MEGVSLSESKFSSVKIIYFKILFIPSKYLIFLEYTFHFIGITAHINTELVSSQRPLQLSWPEHWTRFAGSRDQVTADGPEVTFLASGPSWVVYPFKNLKKYKIERKLKICWKPRTRVKTKQEDDFVIKTTYYRSPSCIVLVWILNFEMFIFGLCFVCMTVTIESLLWWRMDPILCDRASVNSFIP